MSHLKSLGDRRLTDACTYCRGPEFETSDHVPSKVLLDEPFPDNLPVVPACSTCNGGFSLDEEYLATLLDCVLTGTDGDAPSRRPKVASILRVQPLLANHIAKARSVVDGRVTF